MVATLRAIRTAVPEHTLRQPEVAELFAAQPGLGRLATRLIGASFGVSGIETRHTVIGELDGAGDEGVFLDRESGELRHPGTKVRNDLYTREAGRLYVQAARESLDAAPDLDAADVTHVITVSCTGFFAPGPDFLIAQELGLRAGVQRYHFGFMGCYASMPALRAAAQFCEADPDAVVLIVSVELCTLHLRSADDQDSIIAASLFADGAAAALVTGRPTPVGETGLVIDRSETVITPVGVGDMTWTIGDHGFEMVLSSYVPHIIDEHVDGALAPLLGELAPSDVTHWAVHPGGRSILDKVESRMGLSEAQLVPARETLRTFGNMSSATVLFVLRNILENSAPRHGDRLVAMAFGPGLTVESALMTVEAG